MHSFASDIIRKYYFRWKGTDIQKKFPSKEKFFAKANKGQIR